MRMLSPSASLCQLATQMPQPGRNGSAAVLVTIFWAWQSSVEPSQVKATHFGCCLGMHLPGPGSGAIASYMHSQQDVRHARSSGSLLCFGLFHASCRMGRPEAGAWLCLEPCMTCSRHLNTQQVRSTQKAMGIRCPCNISFGIMVQQHLTGRDCSQKRQSSLWLTRGSMVRRRAACLAHLEAAIGCLCQHR